MNIYQNGINKLGTEILITIQIFPNVLFFMKVFYALIYDRII